MRYKYLAKFDHFLLKAYTAVVNHIPRAFCMHKQNSCLNLRQAEHQDLAVLYLGTCTSLNSAVQKYMLRITNQYSTL